MTTSLTDREYEVLAILNDNFETLSPEKQERVMIMFCAAQGYKPYKIPPSGSNNKRPKSNFKQNRKAKKPPRT